jgi:1-deoxy-D-xylulose-5-phosphate reductoisomerase
MKKKRITILGSTGSIGRQALDIVEKFPDRFQVTSLCAGENLELLAEQARKFKPGMVSVINEQKAIALKKMIPGKVSVAWGEEGLDRAAVDDADLVLMSVVGSAGLKPLLKAISRGKTIALANKEPMVMAGRIIMEQARKKSARLIPVDSEHSAIFQLLEGRPRKQLRRVILSASGGPFLRAKKEQLKNVSIAQVLKHPTWKMGRKITVDSATLMNKALELIEAKWLFDLSPQQISVVIHPQSIVHSLVELNDGAVFAHLSVPDMRIPISYALFWPERPGLDLTKLDLARVWELKFEEPDFRQFPALKLGFRALEAGGSMAAAMNAANEEAVGAFLSGKISFNRIVGVVEKVMDGHQSTEPKNLEDVLETDRGARERARKLIDV